MTTDPTPQPTRAAAAADEVHMSFPLSYAWALREGHIARTAAIIAKHFNDEAVKLERAEKLRDLYKEQRDRLEEKRGDWVPGRKCTECKGHGEDDEAHSCPSCAGTGSLWMTWEQRAKEAESQHAKHTDDGGLRAAAEAAVEELRAAMAGANGRWDEWGTRAETVRDNLEAAITALRAALAEPATKTESTPL